MPMSSTVKSSKKQGAKDEKTELSPRMRELILGFEAKDPMKAKRPRDEKGRFVSSRAA
jgi:hypothetical protein